MDDVTLSNGVKMPQEGFGVFQIPDHAEAKRVVRDALACPAHFDGLNLREAQGNSMFFSSLPPHLRLGLCGV